MIRLSHNEGHVGPSGAVRRAGTHALGSAHRYPAHLDHADLRAAIARELHGGIDPAWVVVGAGSVSVLASVLDHARAAHPEAPVPVVLTDPGFDAIPLLVERRGMPLRPTAPTADGAADLAAMDAAVAAHGGPAVVVVCSPHSPTGGTVSHAAMTAFLDGLPPRTLVVLDEAYHGFTDDPLAVRGPDLVADRPDLLVVRTFSKVYGLAGLRVGYALGARARAVASHGVPYPVSVASEAAVLAAVADPARVLDHVAAVATELDAIADGLTAHGITAHVRGGNFAWIPLPGADRAPNWAARLAARGVAVRAVPGHGVRITAGTTAETATLLTVVADCRPEEFPAPTSSLNPV